VAEPVVVGHTVVAARLAGGGGLLEGEVEKGGERGVVNGGEGGKLLKAEKILTAVEIVQMLRLGGGGRLVKVVKVVMAVKVERMKLVRMLGGGCMLVDHGLEEVIVAHKGIAVIKLADLCQYAGFSYNLRHGLGINSDRNIGLLLGRLLQLLLLRRAIAATAS
jgi:hypothetical protein